MLASLLDTPEARAYNAARSSSVAFKIECLLDLVY